MADSRRLLSRKEASRLLKISEQEIQTLTTNNKLSVVLKENNNGVQEAFYKAFELEKFKKNQDKSLAKSLKGSAKSNGTRLRSRVSSSELKDPVNDAIESSAISAVEAAAKLILTLDEVAILTHISIAELRDDLKNGRLRGFIKGRGWKVKRADLEDYVRSIYVPKRP
jgi:hypothetical protein